MSINSKLVSGKREILTEKERTPAKGNIQPQQGETLDGPS